MRMGMAAVATVHSDSLGGLDRNMLAALFRRLPAVEKLTWGRPPTIERNLGMIDPRYHGLVAQAGSDRGAARNGRPR